MARKKPDMKPAANPVLNKERKKAKIRIPKLPVPANQRTRKQVMEMIGGDRAWLQRFSQLCAMARENGSWELSFLKRVLDDPEAALYWEAIKVETHLKKHFRLRAELHGQEMRFFLVTGVARELAKPVAEASGEIGEERMGECLREPQSEPGP